MRPYEGEDDLDASLKSYFQQSSNRQPEAARLNEDIECLEQVSRRSPGARSSRNGETMIRPPEAMNPVTATIPIDDRQVYPKY
jgi:hypothetical protein